MLYNYIKCFVYTSGGSDSDSLPVGAVIAIVCVMIIFIVMIIFVVGCIFVKRRFSSMPQDNTDKQPNAVIYEEPVCISSHTSNKADVKLQPNPAYGTSHSVVMDTNPAYESCK